MRKVFTIGETVFDIIFKNRKIHSGKAGGSMLNSSVTLGRLAIDVHFITEIGADEPGSIILEFLQQNNVSCENIHQFKDGRTAIALAFLDDQKNALYSFYKIYPEKRLQQAFPEVTENDIVLFGSFFAITPEVRNPLIRFLKDAKTAGAIIVYDPNIRTPNHGDVLQFQSMIIENISMADIIRGSSEDFKIMFGTTTAKEANKICSDNGCKTLIYTAGSDNVHLYTNNFSKIFSIPDITPCSTIGAGDNFNAGIIYSLINQNVFKKDLEHPNSEHWNKILNMGISLSQQVCKNYDNYISVAFAKRILKNQ